MHKTANTLHYILFVLLVCNTPLCISVKLSIDSVIMGANCTIQNPVDVEYDRYAPVHHISHSWTDKALGLEDDSLGFGM